MLSKLGRVNQQSEKHFLFKLVGLQAASMEQSGVNGPLQGLFVDVYIIFFRVGHLPPAALFSQFGKIFSGTHLQVHCHTGPRCKVMKLT